MINSTLKKQALLSFSTPGETWLPFPDSTIKLQDMKVLLGIYPFSNAPTLKYLCQIDEESRTCIIDQETRNCAIDLEVRTCAPGL